MLSAGFLLKPEKRRVEEKHEDCRFRKEQRRNRY